MVIVRGNEHGVPRLFPFNITLIPLGKTLIRLFSLQLWINSRAARAFYMATDLREKYTEFQTAKFRLKIDLVPHLAFSGGVG